MRRMTGHIVILAMALLAAVVGCQRRPLEVAYQSTVRVVVKCIWKVDAYPEAEKPSGVTMFFFRDGRYYSSVTTSNVDSCVVQLEEGRYQMYLISQSPDEYWRMQFEHTTDYEDAAVRLRETSSAAWAAKASNADEAVVENPEILCAGVSETFEITATQTEEYQYWYNSLRKLRAAKDTKSGSKSDDERYYEERVEYYTIHVVVNPTNIVSQLAISIYAGNADVLKAVRASTSGMARTFELTQDRTATESAIQVMREWRLTMDDEGRRVGHIDGVITTFGLPNGEDPSVKRDSSLNVSALLIDNATIADYKFEVGDKIRMLDPNPGYRHLYRLVFGSVEQPAISLPDVRPEPGTGGGFSAGVEDWGEEQVAEVVL